MSRPSKGGLEELRFSEQAANVLVGAGRKFTQPRREILGVLERAWQALDAPAIHLALRAQGSRVDRASVYRSLAVLEAERLVHRIQTAGGFIACRHSLTSEDPASTHHHLVCGRCGLVRAFTSAELSRPLQATASEHNFQVTGVLLEVTGLCADCRHHAAPKPNT